MSRLLAELANKRILITGGFGFIGSAIARRLAGIADITLADILVQANDGEGGFEIKAFPDERKKV